MRKMMGWDGWVDGCAYIGLNDWMDGWMDRWVDGCAYIGLNDGWMGGWMDGWMDVHILD